MPLISCKRGRPRSAGGKDEEIRPGRMEKRKRKKMLGKEYNTNRARS
jgi:hypothetical protein